jgi:tRNA modification GTPase
MSLKSFHDTICALSTPPGRSAIASIRITGEDSIAIASRLLREPHRLFSALGGQSVHADLVNESGERIDDGVVAVYRAPHSFTGEDIVEIFPHGSTIITDWIIERLFSLGARVAEPGEFSRRALINGKLTLEEIEATNIRTDTASASHLGSAERITKIKFARLRTIYEKIIELLALVNAQIDFGESDNVEVEGLEERIAFLQKELADLLAAAQNKTLNKGYISVAFTGPPNAGKSSLFNALLRYERSIVSETPGTTRDYVEAFLTLDGFRIKLIDTAGLREANDAIESRGIALGKSASEEADIIFRLSGPELRNIIAANGEIILHNKSDLDNYKDEFAVSAKTHDGVENLINVLEKYLRELDSESSGLSLSQTEVSSIKRTVGILENVLHPEDITIAAENLREAADIIASLIGLNISEDSLNHIFLKMCIGK